MATAFTATRVLDAPADLVWEELTDWSSAAGWLGVQAVRAEGPTAVGTRLAFTARGRERRSEITALETGRSITLRSVQGGVTADYRYAVEPDGPRSRVTLVADVRTAGLWTLLAPVLRAAIRREDSGQLDALARRLAQR